MLESRIPEGPIEKKWEKCRFEMKLVNPANRRKHSIIVVGSGASGSGRSSLSWTARVSSPLLLFSRQPAPGALHCRAGRHQRREELSQRRRQYLSSVL